MKLTMLSGLPGSGKTTEARAEVVATGNSGRINRDDLRAMLFDSVWSGKREQVVIDCEKAIAHILFDHAMNPIIDDTNLSNRHRDMWLDVAKQRGQNYMRHDFAVDIAICRERDAKRVKSVGRAVIDRMALQNGMIEWGDKPLLLCDIDGTLSDGSHREHLVQGENKDWPAYFAKMFEDGPNSEIIRKVNDLYPTHTVCLVSGRPDTYQRETMLWLIKQGVPYHWLFMRPGSDRRPDVQIKAEFLKHMPKDKIALVIDDRPVVCRMWEENGLTVEWVRGRDCLEF
jgi:predicted kinase